MGRAERCAQEIFGGVDAGDMKRRTSFISIFSFNVGHLSVLVFDFCAKTLGQMSDEWLIMEEIQEK